MVKSRRRHQREGLAYPEPCAMKGGGTMQDRDIQFAILVVMILQLVLEIITALLTRQ